MALKATSTLTRIRAAIPVHITFEARALRSTSRALGSKCSAFGYSGISWNRLTASSADNPTALA